MEYTWPDYVDNFSEFTEDEAKLMDQHFDFYWALYNEEREANSDLQRQFIDNCSNGTPKTGHEYAFYKFLIGSGNFDPPIDENYEPISEHEFIKRLQIIIQEQGLLEFYINNHWSQYVESRYDFTTNEAYILDLESGYLAAVYDEVIEAPDKLVSELVKNCYNGAPQSLRETAFCKFLEHATFPEYVEPEADSENVRQPDAKGLPISENSEPSLPVEDDESSFPEPIEQETDNTENERVGSPTAPLPVIKVKKPGSYGEGPLVNTGPTTRGAATVDEILGGNDGKSLRIPEEQIILGVFGSRKAWNRMRGRRNRYNK